MAYDFILLEGVESEVGNTYISTKVTSTLDQDIRIIFAKTGSAKRNENFIYVPEVKVTDVTAKTADLSAINQYKNDKHEFYALRDEKGIDIVKVEECNEIIKLIPQSLGVVKRELLFAATPDLEKVIEEYKKLV